MEKPFLRDTFGITSPIPGNDDKPVRNPSLWRSVPEDPTDPFNVVAEVYERSTGKVFRRPINAGTEDFAYTSIHTQSEDVMRSMNTVITSPEFRAVIASEEMSQERKRLEALVLARRQVFLDSLSPRRRKR